MDSNAAAGRGVSPAVRRAGGEFPSLSLASIPEYAFANLNQARQLCRKSGHQRCRPAGLARSNVDLHLIVDLHLCYGTLGMSRLSLYSRQIAWSEVSFGSQFPALVRLTGMS
jgi:hypothetical protein